mmetsp:Transcript_17890/g.44358  ORF Transcript_17890/g.44358 Transcript_17890/m.44358 type:complete len:115 (+) Transcript_17890:71-415(+)
MPASMLACTCIYMCACVHLNMRVCMYVYVCEKGREVNTRRVNRVRQRLRQSKKEFEAEAEEGEGEGDEEGRELVHLISPARSQTTATQMLIPLSPLSLPLLCEYHTLTESRQAE